MRTKERNEQFLEAAEKDNLVKVKQLVDQGVDINYQDGGGYAALTFATENNNVDMVRYLLSLNGVETNIEHLESKDEIGGIPLHIAAYKGHLEIIRLLVQASPETINDTEDGPEYTPLHEAVLGEQPEAFKLLLTLGADSSCKTGPDCYGIEVPQGLNAYDLILHESGDIKDGAHADMLKVLTRREISAGGIITDDSSSSSDETDCGEEDFSFSHLKSLCKHFSLDYVCELYAGEFSSYTVSESDEEVDFDFVWESRREVIRYFGVEEDFIGFEEILKKELKTPRQVAAKLHEKFDSANLLHVYDREEARQLGNEAVLDSDDSFTDSDSEENLVYNELEKERPFKKPRYSTSNDEYVVHARGQHIHKGVSFFQRRALKENDRTGSLSSFGVHSSDSHKRAGIDFALPVLEKSDHPHKHHHKQKEREDRLLRKSKQIADELHKLKASGPVTPVFQRGTKSSRKKYESCLTEFLQRYVNSYASLKEDIFLANERAGKVRRNQRTQKKQEILEVFKGFPFVSVSENIGVGLEYSYAILNYDKNDTHLPREKLNFTQTPKYNANGTLKHPYLGVIHITLHSKEELKADSMSVLESFKDNLIDTHKGPGTHSTSGYVRAFERVFFGGIASDKIAFSQVVRLPNLYHEWRPFVLEKYNLNEDQYNRFKQNLKKYGHRASKNSPMRNPKKFYRTQRLLIKCIIEHMREKLIKDVLSSAEKNNIKVGHLDNQNNFVSGFDGLDEKLTEAETIRKSKQLQTNSARYGFARSDVGADGNSGFRVLSSQKGP